MSTAKHKEQPEKFDGTTPIMVIDAGSQKRKSDLLMCAKHVKYDYVIHASQTMFMPVDLKWEEHPESGSLSISLFSAMKQIKESKAPITKKVYRASFCVKEKDLDSTIADIHERGWLDTEVIKVK
ncbi:MAG TPA: hypothetical protein VNY36_03010 [Bacteroidia bacterium]|jgi:hypothetical protein|nr:hypothetical protein [Bacteroidia bacterium]